MAPCRRPDDTASGGCSRRGDTASGGCSAGAPTRRPVVAGLATSPGVRVLMGVLATAAWAFWWADRPLEAGEVRSLSAPELEQGRKLYVGKCAKCHAFYEPSHYSAADWGVWLEKMAETSKLKPEQTELLKRYTEKLRLESPAPSRKPETKPKGRGSAVRPPNPEETVPGKPSQAQGSPEKKKK